MHRDQIAKRIRELAAERGGHIGFRDFLKEVGLSEQWLRGQPWFPGWNNLLTELGLQTRRFEPPQRNPNDAAAMVADLIRRLGHWPTEDEFRRERALNGTIPSVAYIRKLRRSGEFSILIAPHAQADPSNQTLQFLAAEKPQPEDSVNVTRTKDRVQGYVYMLRSGRKYKIGKSTDPSRRFREVRLELPDETVQVHAIATDDPTGIEAYWHRRFAAKRVRNTEFFVLDADDIRAFKLRKFQ
ncbi:MAG: GIY-YIG nuclease family protein [Acidithiobacillus ferriphilus]